MSGFGTTEQPMPCKSDAMPIALLVINDIAERAEAGRSRYGEYLKVDNGRDALTDAYQEAIDLVMYLRQLLEARDAESV